jgi:soluble cytochrome b562
MQIIENSHQQPPMPLNKGKSNGTSFKKGHAGGPGRTKGSRNKSTLVLEQIGIDEAVSIWRTVLNLAKGGDLNACKIALDRVFPVRKGAWNLIENTLGKMNHTDIGDFASRTVTAFKEGSITSEEMKDVLDGLERAIKVMTSTDIIKKINDLTQMVEAHLET